MTRARNGQNVSAVSQHKLTRYTTRHASAALKAAGIIENPRKLSPQTILATYLQWHEHKQAERLCEHCKKQPARPRGRYCTDRCARAAAERRRRQRRRAKLNAT